MSSKVLLIEVNTIEKAKFLKYSRRLLLARPHNLNSDGKIRLANVLLTDEDIRLAYILKKNSWILLTPAVLVKLR